MRLTRGSTPVDGGEVQCQHSLTLHSIILEHETNILVTVPFCSLILIESCRFEVEVEVQ